MTLQKILLLDEKDVVFGSIHLQAWPPQEQYAMPYELPVGSAMYIAFQGLSDALVSKDRTIIEMRQLLDAGDQAVSESSELIKAAHLALDERDAEIVSLKDELIELHRKFKEASKSSGSPVYVKYLEQDLAVMTHRREKWQRICEGKNKIIAVKNQQLRELGNKCTQLSEMIEKLKESDKERVYLLTEKDNLISSLNATIDRLSGKIHHLSAECQGWEGDRNSWKREAEKLCIELAEAQKDLDRVTKLAQNEVADNYNKEVIQRIQNKAVEQAFQNAHCELNEKDRLIKNLNEWRQLAQSKTKEVDSLKKERDALKSTCADWVRVVAERDKKITELDAELMKANAILKDHTLLVETNDKGYEAYQNLSARFAGLEVSRQRLGERVIQLESILSKKEKEVRGLVLEDAIKEETIKFLKNECMELSVENKKLDERLAKQVFDEINTKMPSTTGNYPSHDEKKAE